MIGAVVRSSTTFAARVRAQAVPTLITGTGSRVPGLPTRYEISVAHRDDQAALATGSRLSAAQLRNDRVGTIAVSRELVETVGHMERAPSADQITAWRVSL